MESPPAGDGHEAESAMSFADMFDGFVHVDPARCVPGARIRAVSKSRVRALAHSISTLSFVSASAALTVYKALPSDLVQAGKAVDDPTAERAIQEGEKTGNVWYGVCDGAALLEALVMLAEEAPTPQDRKDFKEMRPQARLLRTCSRHSMVMLGTMLNAASSNRVKLTYADMLVAGKHLLDQVRAVDGELHLVRRAMDMYHSLASNGRRKDAAAYARVSDNSKFASSPAQGFESENTFRQRLQIARKFHWPALHLMQSVMTEIGYENLWTSSNTKATGIHKLTSLQQKRLITRVKFLKKDTGAVTKSQVDAASFAMTVTSTHISRLLGYLGYNVYVNDDAGLEAVDENCTVPEKTPTGEFRRELLHMVNTGAADKLIAEQISDQGTAADTSHMIPPALLQAARAGGEDSATRCRVAEGRTNVAQVSRNGVAEKNEMGDSETGGPAPVQPELSDGEGPLSDYDVQCAPHTPGLPNDPNTPGSPTALQMPLPKGKQVLNIEASAVAREKLSCMNIEMFRESFELFSSKSYFGDHVRGRAMLVIVDLPYNIGVSKGTRDFISAEDVKRVVTHAAEACATRGNILLFCSWQTYVLIVTTLQNMGSSCPVYFNIIPITIEREVVLRRRAPGKMMRPDNGQELVLVLYKSIDRFTHLDQPYSYLKHTTRARTVNIIDHVRPFSGKFLWNSYFEGYLDTDDVYSTQTSGLRAPRGSRRRKQIRPEQKSIDLLKDLGLAYCKPGGLWYDCMCGTGTAGIAALELGSPAVMTDIDFDCIDASAPLLLQLLEKRKMMQGAKKHLQRRKNTLPESSSDEGPEKAEVSSHLGSVSEQESHAGDDDMINASEIDANVEPGSGEGARSAIRDGCDIIKIGKDDEREEAEPPTKKQKMEIAGGDADTDQQLLQLLDQMSSSRNLPLMRKRRGRRMTAARGFRCAAASICAVLSDDELTFDMKCGNMACASDANGGGRLHDMCAGKVWMSTAAKKLDLWSEPANGEPGYCSLTCWKMVARSARM